MSLCSQRKILDVKVRSWSLGEAASGDMQHRCSRCAAPIQRQAKGYKRKSLLSITDLRSAHRLFPDLNPQEAFFCFSCVRHVYQNTKKCGKKRVYVDPHPPTRPAPPARPAPSAPGDPPPPKKLKRRLRTALDEHDYASRDPAPSARTEPPQGRRVRRGPISQVCGYLRRKNFTCALNRLLQVSGFKEALIRLCGKLISTEVRPDTPERLIQNQNPLRRITIRKLLKCNV